MTPPPATVTTIAAIHAAILAALKARFGDRIARFGAYELRDEFDDAPEPAVLTPALLLQLEEFEAEEQAPMDPFGRLALRCTWVIHCQLGILTQNLQAQLPQIAAAVASVIKPVSADGQRRGNTWGLAGAVEYPERITGQPGGFRPGLNGVDTWVCRFEQIVYIAEELP